ncbi:MAG TPA: HesA/MoeB/ThiF family protein [Geopsychrobacteraceae bacterium]
MNELLAWLRRRSDGDLLPWPAQREAARRFATSSAAVEAVALANDLLPARYQRNRAMLSIAQQQRLFGSCAAVVGCGGLGGYVLEQLSRLGVGRLIAIDPDIFVEHNLNRQLLATIANLGRPKALAAAERIAAINPAVTVTALPQAFGPDNGARLLQGADIVIDCLDSVRVRLALADCCAALGVPLVHGAIAGWYGHICTVFPGDPSLNHIYPPAAADKGAEQQLGNPSFTPALIASLEAAEVCKVLLSEGAPLRDRMLTVDLREMDFEQIDW